MYFLLIRNFYDIVYLLHGDLHLVILSHKCHSCKSFWLTTKGCLLSIHILIKTYIFHMPLPWLSLFSYILRHFMRQLINSQGLFYQAVSDCCLMWLGILNPPSQNTSAKFILFCIQHKKLSIKLLYIAVMI
jgi:hypothetical protein